jgi:hypothetical protein
LSFRHDFDSGESVQQPLQIVEMASQLMAELSHRLKKLSHLRSNLLFWFPTRLAQTCLDETILASSKNAAAISIVSGKRLELRSASNYSLAVFTSS